MSAEKIDTPEPLPPAEEIESSAPTERYEYATILKICADTRRIPQIPQEKQRRIFYDFRDKKNTTLGLLLREPDVMRAAILLCIPARHFSQNLEDFNCEEAFVTQFGIQYYTSPALQSGRGNPIEDFLKRGNIRKLDAILARAQLKEKFQDKDAAENDIEDAEEGADGGEKRGHSEATMRTVREYGGRFLRRESEGDREKVLGALMKYGLPPVVFEFLSQFSENQDAAAAVEDIRETHTRIVTANAHKAATMARFFVFNRGASALTSYSLGLQGLMKAVDMYDPDRGMSFLSYAHLLIKTIIVRCFREEKYLIHIPVSMQTRIAKVRRLIEASVNLTGEFSVPEIAARAELTVAQVEETLGAIRLRHGHSLDARLPDKRGNHNQTLHDTMRCGTLETPEQILIQGGLLQHSGAELLKGTGLDKRSRFIITKHYIENLNLREIADLMGLSPEGVRQIEKKALEKMRRTAIRKGLMDEENK